MKDNSKKLLLLIWGFSFLFNERIFNQENNFCDVTDLTYPSLLLNNESEQMDIIRNGDGTSVNGETNILQTDEKQKMLRSTPTKIQVSNCNYILNENSMWIPDTNFRCLERVTDNPSTISQSSKGSNWTQQSVGASVTLFCVSVVNDKIVWTGGQNGVVFRTTNAGSNWTQTTNVPTDASSIFGLNADTAFVCANFTNDGRIYRTTNTGVSWTLSYQYTGSTAAILNVTMFDVNTGIAIGNPVGGFWRIFKTTNGGSSWEPHAQIQQYQSEYGMKDAVDWINDKTGWFGSDIGRVYRTSDGGSTWSYSDVSMGSDVFSLVFSTDKLGMISTPYRSIYKTSDGGSLWSYASTVPGTPFVLVSFLAGIDVPTPRWWATNMDEIYQSNNHGVTWTYETVASGYPFNDISMKYVPDRGIIVGYTVAAGSGIVMRYSESVISAPSAPILISPPHRAIVNTDTVFCVWGASTPAVTHYRFDRATDSLFT